MFAAAPGSLARRRGIVLVVVLGMLGLMALIGVTFATFAGQSLISGRNFAQGVARPQAEALMDYALAQLINDTNNPISAIRGHSLLRDMYGNDSVFRGANPASNPAAESGGLITSVYSASAGTYVAPQLQLLGFRTNSAGTPFYNQIQVDTNIPTSGQYYGLDFTRWILKVQGIPAGTGAAPAANGVPTNGFATQTFEILEDFAPQGPTATHKFTLANNLGLATVDPRYVGTNPPTVPSDWATFQYVDGNYISTNASYGVVSTGSANAPAYSFLKATASLAEEWNYNSTTNTQFFTLDGRNMRAFNGPGLTGISQRVNAAGTAIDAYPYNSAAYGNFRLNGINPDAQGMDEDYDACDLENWFLALQSADGQVVIPSFHRPGILMAADWGATASIAQAAKILRPRQADNSPLFPPDPSTPDPLTGKLTYDIDNDGDGVTDSVWVDLGYPIQRDPGGKLYKPLFAFMVLGLNGRLPLNTVGNLQARATTDATNNANVGGLVNTTGQVPQPGTAVDSNVPPLYYKSSMNNPFFLNATYGNQIPVSSQTYYDAPLFDHASHLGYSVNEINPKFALQNAPSNAYFSLTSNPNNNNAPIGRNVNGNNFSQVDDAGVSVALTQMRNILAGTIPTDLPYPYTGPYPLTAKNSPNEVMQDVNTVMVDGKYMIFPNNMADLNDIQSPGASYIARFGQAVAGRWGEPSGILSTSLMPLPGSAPYQPYNVPIETNQGSPTIVFPGLLYNNPVRAGLSFFVNPSNGQITTDAMDDDFDGTDPVLAQYAAAQLYYREPTATGSSTNPPNTVQLVARGLPEFADNFDVLGARAVASERIRQFVTPIDPGGVGRVVDFMNRPNSDIDYGSGHDTKGRASYFRYFRTPGMPQDIRYPYGGPSSSYTYTPPNAGYPYPVGGYFGHRFLMPQLFPAGSLYSLYTAPNGMPTGASDIHNNRYHGYQSMLTPEWAANGPSIQTIASMGTMPYDWDNSLSQPLSGAGIPAGYPGGTTTASVAMPPPTAPPLGTNYVNNFAPTLNPSSTITSVNSSSGPNFGLSGNQGTMPAPPFPIAYGGYQSATDTTQNSQPLTAPVVNGYLGGVVTPIGNFTAQAGGGGLNKDEADEMNLYAPSRYDMPYGPSDLEWLYRLQDVDGATLSSRLAKLAPVSFLNPADGLTRRRLFSTDSWEPTGWVYANDNPTPYAGAAYGTSTDHLFTYNSRFTPTASPSLEIMNQIDGSVTFPSGLAGLPLYLNTNVTTPAGTHPPAVMANPVTTEYLPNPTFPTINPNNTTQASSYLELNPNSNYATPIDGQSAGLYNGGLPTSLDLNSKTGNFFDLFKVPQVATYYPTAPNVPFSSGGNSMVQVQTPALAHRDRRINLNFPLPISHDPGEPVRQKWCRETYTLLKAILPPASVDTPEELAALSQFVVNIIDFRDPDPTMTRFVNTDLIVTDVLTKTASNIQPTTVPATLPPGSYGYDSTWNVSPPGVRFALASDAANLGNHFPYDPSLYSPDATSPFLVQHGMEYNPIALNEVLGYTVPYGSTGAINQTTSGIFIELVNTLTEEQNNNNSNSNSSAISLLGWDLVLAPDDYGWGRPDPISGDVSTIAYPPLLPNPGMPAGTKPGPNAVAGSPLANVKYFPFAAADYVQAMNGNMANTNILVKGTSIPSGAIESSTGASGTASATTTPFAHSSTTFIPSTGPNSFLPTLDAGKQGQYFWIYLRRPANPFDTMGLTGDRPNREMVVVDAMRFPFINAGTAGTVTGDNFTTAPNEVYSARRLQPYRGGHLLPTATTTPNPAAFLADGMTKSLANGVSTICPPSPAHAYGYSEQTCPTDEAGSSFVNVGGQYKTTSGMPAYKPTTKTFRQTLGQSGATSDTPRDDAWSHFPFHDRDFTSVAELLLVPGCPPGLFTKQFVEEPYPGNVVATTVTNYQTAPTMTPMNPAPVTYATNVQYLGTYAGSDDTTLNATMPIAAPAIPAPSYPNSVSGANTTSLRTITSNPAIGRANFGRMPTFGTNPNSPPAAPVAPTFPYLPDNFYYTAASVAPATSGGSNYPAYYSHLTTEIGGWTGNGWHKMMEFFEVPSSANGAIGSVAAGTNFDWARADIKPGLLNLNLIIDEEVFAGLFDDPRLNERLAAYSAPGLTNGSATIPQIVTQIDANGYAVAHYSISDLVSVNQLNQAPLDAKTLVNADNSPSIVNNNATSAANALLFGRGYTVKDPDSQNYVQLVNTSYYPYQQLHGIKAAFSDFLKLRHGGSGFLFAHGAGPTGSGDVFHGNTWPVSQPIAAERPYRSMSYPDINYTLMRPASLPPSQVDTNNLPKYRWTASTPALPDVLSSLFSYATYTPNTNNAGMNSYVELNLNGNTPLAPRNFATNPFPYVFDPGVKNPFLSNQYANTNVPDTGSPSANAPPTVGSGGPPYPALPYNSTLQFVPAAPFPPPIPPTPAARLIQVPDLDTSAGTAAGPIPPPMAPYPSTGVYYTSNAVPGQSVAVPAFPSSNASVAGQHDGSATPAVSALNGIGGAYLPLGSVSGYSVNWPVTTQMLYNGGVNPPTLVPPSRAAFLPDNNTPQPGATFAPQTLPATSSGTAAPNSLVQAGANNYLGAGAVGAKDTSGSRATSNVNPPGPTATGLSPADNSAVLNADRRQHPMYRTEWLQKIMNLTTVRTHQFAVWITVGFFEVVKPGTPELGLPDVLGQELGLTAGRNIRYRSFFTLDRTKAAGFNPYYPGNFRDCVTYRRRIE